MEYSIIIKMIPDIIFMVMNRDMCRFLRNLLRISIEHFVVMYKDV